ncbi:MAG: dUTP diphosphatase [Patescibacteria group bacterium]
MSLKLKIKKLQSDALVPKYALLGDAAFDLYAQSSTTVSPGKHSQIPTGIAMAIPEGYVGLIWDKSSIAIREGIKTLGGVIDAGYRGEIIVGVVNLSEKEYTFEKGHKVAQMIIQERLHADIIEVEELNETIRGSGGFGSTGK